ncbi:hypothetical protein ACFL52_01305 [Candidatus Margulisiibacteriota bacterium]
MRKGILICLAFFLMASVGNAYETMIIESNPTTGVLQEDQSTVTLDPSGSTTINYDALGQDPKYLATVDGGAVIPDSSDGSTNPGTIPDITAPVEDTPLGSGGEGKLVTPANTGISLTTPTISGAVEDQLPQLRDVQDVEAIVPSGGNTTPLVTFDPKKFTTLPTIDPKKVNTNPPLNIVPVTKFIAEDAETPPVDADKEAGPVLPSASDANRTSRITRNPDTDAVQTPAQARDLDTEALQRANDPGAGGKVVVYKDQESGKTIVYKGSSAERTSKRVWKYHPNTSPEWAQKEYSPAERAQIEQIELARKKTAKKKIAAKYKYKQDLYKLLKR